MSVGAAIPRQHAAFGSADSRGWRTLSDLTMVVVIAPVSRAAGFTLNRLFIAAAAGRLQEPGATVRQGADDAGVGGATRDRVSRNCFAIELTNDLRSQLNLKVDEPVKFLWSLEYEPPSSSDNDRTAS